VVRWRENCRLITIKREKSRHEGEGGEVGGRKKRLYREVSFPVSAKNNGWEGKGSCPGCSRSGLALANGNKEESQKRVIKKGGQ